MMTNSRKPKNPSCAYCGSEDHVGSECRQRPRTQAEIDAALVRRLREEDNRATAPHKHTDCRFCHGCHQCEGGPCAHPSRGL